MEAFSHSDMIESTNNNDYNNISSFLMKVIANLGLCISVYDINSVSGGFIFPGDGASTYTVCVDVCL